MVLPSLLLATGVALSPAPGAGSRWHSPVATHVDRTPRHVRHGHEGRYPAESGRRHAAAHSVGVHRPALHASVRQVRESAWVLLVRPQHRRLLPALAPAQARILEPGFLAHRDSATAPVGPWIRIFDGQGKSWVNVSNLAPATEPVGWDKLVLKIHPILRPRVTPSPPLPVANTVPAASTGTVAATPQPVVVQQQVVVQPVVQQPAPVVVQPALPPLQQLVHDRAIAIWGQPYDFELNFIISHESGWQLDAYNTSSGATGLWQALPWSKTGCYSTADAVCQVNWGLSYIQQRYGTPAGAYSWWLNNGWY